MRDEIGIHTPPDNPWTCSAICLSQFIPLFRPRPSLANERVAKRSLKAWFPRRPSSFQHCGTFKFILGISGQTSMDKFSLHQTSPRLSNPGNFIRNGCTREHSNRDPIRHTPFYIASNHKNSMSTVNDLQRHRGA